MPRQYPQRINAHQLEEMSERYFRSLLPRNWTCEKLEPDYGVDLRVDLYDDQEAKGLELLVQLKASAESTNTEFETIQLETKTYNLLYDKLQVVMLVKYIESENKAYWILLKDVPYPNMDNKSFIIHIPRANDVSVLQWNSIYDYVRDVTTDKLEARGRRILE